MPYDQAVDSAFLEGGLKTIGNAIREKNGETGAYTFPDIMAEKIRAISASDPTKAIIILTAPAGSTVTVSFNGKTKTAREKGGTWTFTGLEVGENVIWVARAVKADKTATLNIPTPQPDFYRRTLAFRQLPAFTYTGDYEVVQDDNTPIGPENSNTGAMFDDYRGNAKIRFLTSGNLTFSALNAWQHIEVFLVGGGGAGAGSKGHAGAGGGGGYTKTKTNLSVELSSYEIEVGDGSNTQDPGNTTTAFGISAPGGQSPRLDSGTGGNGGSGGGGKSSDGGSDGRNGSGSGGTGQKNAPEYGYGTREFNEMANPELSEAQQPWKLYSGGGSGWGGGKGGAGGGGTNGPGAVNSGGGGGSETGYNGRYTKGGSGIVVIRNSRGA